LGGGGLQFVVCSCLSRQWGVDDGVAAPRVCVTVVAASEIITGGGPMR
jgi:hypothetical protein